MAKNKISRQQILPNEKSPFTIKEIRDAIPKYCFIRDMKTSFIMLFKDILVAFVTFAAAIYLDKFFCKAFSGALLLFLRIIFWTSYSIYQGINLTALWVIAHECGHESFVESKFINDLVGYIIHTPLIVPYFSWQKSHSLHHHFTNNLQKDQVWVPEIFDNTKEDPERKPFFKNVIDLILMSVVGWPLYIIMNATGPKTKGFVSHFWPSSEIYNDGEFWKVVLSGAGVIGWIYVLFRMCIAFGLGFMTRIYFCPLIVVFFFLTSITFLQHTDEVIPHYDDSEWNWLRGALCTVDRPISHWMDKKLHYIHSHHVVHHLFSKLPSYHAPEATEAIKKICGSYYIKSNTNYFIALWNNYRDCLFLESDNKLSKIYWWKDLININRELRTKKES